MSHTKQKNPSVLENNGTRPERSGCTAAIAVAEKADRGDYLAPPAASAREMCACLSVLLCKKQQTNKQKNKNKNKNKTSCCYSVSPGRLILVHPYRGWANKLQVAQSNFTPVFFCSSRARSVISSRFSPDCLMLSASGAMSLKKRYMYTTMKSETEQYL